MKKAKSAPDFSFEKTAGAFQGQIVCGTDEAGRGPLAGPVVAAAVILPPDLVEQGLFAQFNDSKVMSAKARATAFELITTTSVFCIAEATVAEIDAINILQASMLAMKRAVEGLPARPGTTLVDGNRAPDLAPDLAAGVQTLVKGDSRSLSIAAASILAKEHRDALMRGLHEEFPVYGWAQNKGYPTRAHREAIDAFGATPHHRMSFAPLRQIEALRR